MEGGPVGVEGVLGVLVGFAAERCMNFMVRSLEDMVLGSFAGGAMIGEFDIFAAVVQS